MTGFTVPLKDLIETQYRKISSFHGPVCPVLRCDITFNQTCPNFINIPEFITVCKRGEFNALDGDSKLSFLTLFQKLCDENIVYGFDIVKELEWFRKASSVVLFYASQRWIYSYEDFSLNEDGFVVDIP